MNIEKISALAKDVIMTYGPKLIAAVVVFIIGRIIIKAIAKSFDKILAKKDIDPSLKPFLTGIIKSLLQVMLVISVLSMLGIEMTSFVAILGAAGLAVGMALSGTLQNFAGGVMILIFKPFKSGDFIDAQGHTGTVSEIQIFNTILKTPDNKTIIIPNGGLSTSSMTNFSTEQRRRVDWTFGVGYGDNLEKAKSILHNLMNEDKRILNDPAPFVALSELADSSVNFATRAWVEAENYWDVYFEMNEKVYEAFNKEGLNIPFPQMELHVNKNN